MRYMVSSVDLSNVQLNVSERINSVLQNIAVILATPRGSVPLYRDFGIPWEFLDKPTPAAKNMMVPIIREAIEQWEPRAIFVKVHFLDDEGTGMTIPIVEVEILDE